MRLVRLRNSNPSPPAFASIRRGTQSSPLAKGRGGITAVELTANEYYSCSGDDLTADGRNVFSVA